MWLPSTYTYDHNGNTLTDAPGRSYVWDLENRLTAVTVPGVGQVTFRSDPFGRHVSKTSPLGTSIYLYDGANLAEERDGAGTLVARYTQGPGIDEQVAQERAPAATFYQRDGLGSVTSLTDGMGAPAGSYTFDAFGRLIASTGTVPNPLRYTGREFDAESGLYYYRARYYEPAVGRFRANSAHSIAILKACFQ